MDTPDKQSAYKRFYGENPDYVNNLRKFGEMAVMTILNTNKT